MLFANERITKEAHNDDWSIIVKEIVLLKDGQPEKVYCRTHINFEDSPSIHESFESVCGMLHISLNCPFIVRLGDTVVKEVITIYEDTLKDAMTHAGDLLKYRRKKGYNKVEVEVI
jgi:hypothetical protein